jgi:hypothetical protein
VPGAAATSGAAPPPCPAAALPPPRIGKSRAVFAAPGNGIFSLTGIASLRVNGMVEGGMAQVMHLCPRERVWLDPTRIGALYAELGGAEVRALLDRAMGEMAGVRREMAVQFGAHDLEGFARNLRRMRRIAEHLGLTSLGTVAGDVTACLERGDATALSATWARLARSADQALAGGWDMPG